MLPTEPVAVSFDECSSCSADQIGHLQRWPAHLAVAFIANYASSHQPLKRLQEKAKAICGTRDDE
jgi:hypothetical protein